ncbi:haloacid dehalogenase-like hydrolase domain-containing protein At4g39970 isoform X5 [Andrographis paniculata]|uniref:haloacid dehalogenase-like hydrolase domain-containing protein At4g39970 isoform X5 n=1 Tax=Andrographis paniculata TaxID=175694 RepID=UPI0021E7DD19|nr:haloacid dehalogenase-like hydrolase domain-containing protein At4g39970 isoform X5 [Andrographis paniculata]
MASSAVFLFPIPPPPTPSNSPPSLLCSVPPLVTIFNKTHTTRTASCRPLLVSASASASSHSLQALIFDCDGVILESEHLHRQAYNDAFQHFSVRCPSSSSPLPLNWSPEFYDELQNFIGGGKPKMRWYFKENGWPTSTVFNTPPEKDEDRAKLIDILQDWKTERYKKILKSGTERFQNLDCFLAGDDVKEKKPDPMIYLTAATKLGVSGKDCLVIEDSVIGLQVCLSYEAATGAGMPCVISYTASTANQDFTDAVAIYPDLSNVRLADLEALLKSLEAAK